MFSILSCDQIWNGYFLSKNANLFISTIVFPRPNFRVKVLKFKMEVGLLNL